MMNIILALFANKGLLSKAEAEAFADKIRFATLPGDYKTAAKLVEQLLSEVEKGI